MIQWQERLVAGPWLLLDGATGTELERRGARSSLPLWSAHALLSAPDLVREVHADYAAAGAELLTANTFRTQRRSLARAGLAARAAELTRLAVTLAREAAECAPQPPAVLGSAPPLEDCFAPERVPVAAEIADEHAEHAANLRAAGVDGILIETMNCIREARSAAQAAREAGIPALVSFVCWRGARLLSGEPLSEAVEAVRDTEPAAVLVNCLPPSNVDACLPALAASELPFGVYPNLGAPLDEPGDAAVVAHADEHTPRELAERARAWLGAGVRVLGGCCGTTPGHIAALAQLLRS